MFRTLLFLTGQADYSSLQTLKGLHSELNAKEWFIRTSKVAGMTESWLDQIRPSAVLIEPLDEVDEILDYCERNSIPYVSLGNRLREEPVVLLDEYGAGREIATALINCGFHHFGLLREPVEGHVENRFRGYVETIEAAGYQVHEFSDSNLSPWLDSMDSMARRPEIEDWLQALPKPVGMMALSPMQGYGLIELCQQMSIKVPETLGLVVTYENPIVCEMAAVDISALRIGYQALGAQAGRLFRDWFTQGQFLARVVTVPFHGITHRASSDVVGAVDEVVSRVARWISRHIDQSFKVKDLLPVSGLSRPLLERRFREVLGRSPLQEIHRQRFQCACKHLHQGQESIAMVGQLCGIPDPFMFSSFFKKMAGCSPTEYRLREIDSKRQRTY